MRKPASTLLPNLILCTVAALLALVASELLVRKIAPRAPATNAPSETRGWKALPNLDIRYLVPPVEGGVPGAVRIRTDSHGYRMGRETTSKRAGVFRIVVLGDSFAFGATIHEEYLFANVLERSLASRSPVPVEVVNLGVPGYGVDQERAMLEEEGLSLDPDLVLLALYLGNDLQETLGLHRRVFDPETGGLRGARGHEIVDGRMVPIAKTGGRGDGPRAGAGVKGWFREHLRLYAFLADRLKESAALRTFFTRVGLIKREEVALLPPDDRLEHLWSGGGMVSLLRDAPPAIEEAWRIVTRHLEGIDALCRARGIPLAVIVIPYKAQAVPSKLAEEKVLLGLEDEDLDLEKPNRRMDAWARSRGIPLIDLLPVFAGVPDPAAYYYRRDGHWNDHGQERAGRILAERLIALGLVPSK